jgi:hypothetical protein
MAFLEKAKGRVDQAASLLSSGPINVLSVVSVEGQRTTVDWTVGRVKELRLGDVLQSSLFTAGGVKWWIRSDL